MTVLAWDGKTLAGDRQATDDGGVKQAMLTKVGKVGKDDAQVLWGVSGDIPLAMQRVLWLTSGERNSPWPTLPDTMADVVLVMCNPTRLCLYTDTTTPVEFDPTMFAAGIGREAALAAMLVGADAEAAVVAAIRVVEGCGMGITSVSFDEGEEDEQ